MPFGWCHRRPSRDHSHIGGPCRSHAGGVVVQTSDVTSSKTLGRPLRWLPGVGDASGTAGWTVRTCGGRHSRVATCAVDIERTEIRTVARGGERPPVCDDDPGSAARGDCRRRTERRCRTSAGDAPRAQPLRIRGIAFVTADRRVDSYARAGTRRNGRAREAASAGLFGRSDVPSRPLSQTRRPAQVAAHLSS